MYDDNLLSPADFTAYAMGAFVFLSICLVLHLVVGFAKMVIGGKDNVILVHLPDFSDTSTVEMEEAL